MDRWSTRKMPVSTMRYTNRHGVNILCMVWQEGDNRVGYSLRQIVDLGEPSERSVILEEGYRKTWDGAHQAVVMADFDMVSLLFQSRYRVRAGENSEG